MKIKYRLESTLITYLITAFLVTFAFLTQPNSIGLNSDAVYLPALFNDIFSRGYHFSQWHLTPAPYFFPDMLVFFIIKALFHNTFYSLIIYAVFQNILTLFLISKIAFLVTKEKSSVLLTHIIFLLTLIFSLHSGVECYIFFLKNAYHFGTLINGLFLIYFLISYTNLQKNSTLFLLFCISSLGTASDLVFVTQFVLPIIASLLVCQLLKTKMPFSLGKLVFILIFSSFLGFSQRYFLANAQSHFTFALVHAFSTMEVYHEIFLIYKNAFLKNLVIVCISLLFYFLIIIKFLKRVSLKKNYKMAPLQKEWPFFLSLFIIISIAFTCESLSINGIISERYLLNVFWFPIFFFWILFKEKLSAKILLIILYAISIGLVVNRLSEKPSFVFDYQPDMVRCIDQHIHEYNTTHDKKIRYGISTYWQAKISTVFSNEGMIISQYNPDLSPFLWIANSNTKRN